MKNLFGHRHNKAATAEPATNVTTTTTTEIMPNTEFQTQFPAPVLTPAPEMTQPVQQVIEKTPVFHERIRKEEVEEVQPVIHREHERTEVHQILQPMYEGQIAPAHVLQKQLPAEVLPTITKGMYVPPPSEQNTTEWVESERIMVQKSPIVMETETKKIIEEIQPVIYKETVQPTIIRETKPIYEKIVEAPVVVKEVREPIHLHATGMQKGYAFEGKGREQLAQFQTGSTAEGFTTGRAPTVLEKTVTVQRTHSEIPPQ